MTELFPNELDEWIKAHPETIWVEIPYNKFLLKNQMFGFNHKFGSKFLKKEAKVAREQLTLMIKGDLRSRNFRPGQKVWLDILVAKERHIGDAINFLDAVADCVKVAIDVDDRYFSVRRIDWIIDKEKPRVIVGISQ